MQKKLLVPILLILLTATPTLGATEELFNDVLGYDETTDIEGNELSLNIGSGSAEDVIRVNIAGESSIIQRNRCEDILIYEACYLNYTYDEKADINDQGELVPGLRVRVTKEQEESLEPADPETEFTLPGTPATFGEENQFTLQLINNGNDPLIEGDMTVTAANVDIDQPQNWIATAEELRRGFTLGEDETYTQEFIYAISNISQPEITAEITYEYDGKQHTETKTFQPTYKEPVQITQNLPAQTALYEENRFTVDIVNAANTAVTVNQVDLTVEPINQRLTSTEDYTLRANGLRAENLELEENQDVALQGTYIANYARDTEITITTEIQIGDLTKTYTETQSITTPTPVLEATHTLPETALIAETITATTQLENPSDYDYHDVAITSESTVFDGEQTIGNLSAGETKNIEWTIPVPSTIPEDTYTVPLTTEYETPTNQELTVQTTKELTVQKPAYNAEITTRLTPETPKESQETNLTVTIQNTGTTALEKGELQLSGAVTAQNGLSLEPSEQNTTTYTFTAQPSTPVTITYTHSELTRTASVELGLEQEEPTDTSPTNTNTTPTGNTSESPTNDTGVEEDLEETFTFFGRIVNTLENFFAGLFP